MADVILADGLVTIKDSFGGQIQLPLKELIEVVNKLAVQVNRVKEDMEMQEEAIEKLKAQKLAERGNL